MRKETPGTAASALKVEGFVHEAGIAGSSSSGDAWAALELCTEAAQVSQPPPAPAVTGHE